MLKAFTRLCMLLTSLTFTAAIANADTVIITSGSLSVTGFSGVPVYSFAGTNFAVTGSGSDFGFTGPEVSCFPCVSGSLINTNSNFVDVTLGQGTVTINGSTFDHIFITGALMFTGPSVVVPNTGDLNLILTAPFTLFGTMAGCLEPHLTCHTIVFSTQVAGSGLARIELQGFVDSQGRLLYDFRKVTYTFDNTTVPEPASLLLLTTGLALGATRLRRIRKRRAHSDILIP